MKVMYFVIFIILIHFGVPSESFWAKKRAKSVHLPLDQQVYTNKIKVKTKIVRISVFSLYENIANC